MQSHSGSVPETSRNTYGESQGTNEDRSQNDAHSEARVSQSQSTQDFGPDDSYDRRWEELCRQYELFESLNFQASKLTERPSTVC